MGHTHNQSVTVPLTIIHPLFLVTQFASGRLRTFYTASAKQLTSLLQIRDIVRLLFPSFAGASRLAPLQISHLSCCEELGAMEATDQTNEKASEHMAGGRRTQTAKRERWKRTDAINESKGTMAP